MRLKLAIIALFFLLAQTYASNIDSAALPEVEIYEKDLMCIGLSGGMNIPQIEAGFSEQIFGQPANIVADAKGKSDYYSAFSFGYGLDHYLLPGLMANVKLDYTPTQIDLKLQAYQNQGNNKVFDFDGAMVKMHTFGLMPGIKLYWFPFLDYLFALRLPKSWDIYAVGEARFNFTMYENLDLNFENQNSFTIGWEFGGGIEVYLSENWSLRLEGLLYENSSRNFDIVMDNLTVFSGKINSKGSKIVLELSYYF